MKTLLQKIIKWIRSLFSKQTDTETTEETSDIVEVKPEKHNVEIKIVYMKPITIILDAGHGKETKGKRSPVLSDGRQLLEWQFTRELSNRIKKECDKYNIKCIQSNIDDKDPGLSARASNINQIVKRESEIGRSCLMISLHGNAAGNGGWSNGKGWEVWTTEGATKSDAFANIMCNIFPSIFPDRRLRGHKEKNFTLLYKTYCPCVLTENFFYDNEEECRLMLSEEGLERIVKLHIESIKKYIQY